MTRKCLLFAIASSLLLSVAACSRPDAEKIGVHARELLSASRLQVAQLDDALDPEKLIHKKWVKLGGPQGIGGPIGPMEQTPGGAAKYRRFEQGVIVYTDTWGAVLLTNALFDSWVALVGSPAPTNGDMFDVVGVPTEDRWIGPAHVSAVFERGMLVDRGGAPILVWGEIWVKYCSAGADGTPSCGGAASRLGAPAAASASAATTHDTWQEFDAGEIYTWRRSSLWDEAGEDQAGAFLLAGPTRDRWHALGGASGPLGIPVSDVAPVVRDDDLLTPGGLVLGEQSRFSNGTIYDSAAGVWEVTGAIRSNYENRYGGPAGWLGFPISGTVTTARGNQYVDFENGVLTLHQEQDGYRGMVRAFRDLTFRLQRIEGGGNDGKGDVFDCQDVYMHFSLWTSDAGSIETYRRMPADSDWSCSHDFSDQEWNVSSVRPAHGDLAVHVRVDAWDSDWPDDDDKLGEVYEEFTVDNLWGQTLGTKFQASQDANDMKVWMAIVNSGITIDTGDFPGQLFWSFHNFDTDDLSWAQYRRTFRDVPEDWWADPFKAAFYSIAYWKSASKGNCYGMAVESVYAEIGESLYSQPIFDYFRDTQSGAELVASDGPHTDLLKEINLKHGYQFGSEAVAWLVSGIENGYTHSPNTVYEWSKAAHERGEHPIITIWDSYFFLGGHAVRPYHWDSLNDGTKRIYIADPNDPAGTPTTGPERDYILIDVNGDYSYGDYQGGDWLGGRIFYYPFSKLDERPVTPLHNNFDLFLNGYIVIVGDAGRTAQITDDAGRTLYQTGLGAPAERWDQMQQGAARIPSLARVPITSGGPGEGEMYFGRGQYATVLHDVVPATPAPGTPFEWMYQSGTLASHVSVPASSGVPKRLEARSLASGGFGTSIVAQPGRGHADVTWTIAAGAKGRWARLSSLSFAPGQKIAVRPRVGGRALAFENDGPPTPANLTVAAEGGTSVTVPIVIGSGASTVAFDAPATTAAITAGVLGEAGWYRTPVTVTVSAQDFSGTGIEYIEWSTDLVTWSQAPAPPDSTEVLHDEEGESVLYHRAMDRARNLGDAASLVTKIDTRAPVITVSTDSPQYTRVQPLAVHFGAADPSPGSGIARVTGKLDGSPVSNGDLVDLMWFGLGTHVVSVAAADVAGWEATASASFRVVATLASLRDTILELRRRGEIDEDGIATSMLGRVDNAARLVNSDRPKTSAELSMLESIVRELAAQEGKHVTARAAALLTGDIRLVQAGL